MSKVRIDTALVDGAAKSVANAQNYGVGNTWTTLGSALASTKGMAGNPGKDPSAAKFIAAYTPAVQAAWKGFAALHRSTGDMSRGLTQTAKNHTKADRGSMISGGFSVVPQQQHNTFRDSVLGTTASGPLNVATPPSAAGPGKAAPRSLFETLTGTSIGALDIEDYWPTGDPNLLAMAASAWKAAHDGLVDARGRLTADVKKVTDHSDAPDVDAFGGFWKRLCSGSSPNTVLNGLPQLCLSISRACGEYSEALREAQLQASNVGGNPIAAITSVAALRASLAATAGKLLQTVGAIAVGVLSENLVNSVTIGAANAPNLRILEIELDDSVLREWNNDGSEPNDEDLESDVGQISRQYKNGGYTEKEIEQAIHDVKNGAAWRGLGSNKNPDVVIDVRTGEVYPKTPSGVGEDSLDNLSNHLPVR